MKTKRFFVAVATLALGLATAGAAEWQRLSAKLMTPWGEQIDPENVWQEYPRPQLVRDNWINLNGVWDYFRRTNRVSLSYERNLNSFSQKILVPFPVESALSGIMHTDLSTTANSTLMYRRTFTLTDAFRGKHTLLHFGAVDWRCVVFVNGQEVGSHEGGSDPFTFDITDYLTEEGEQELQVAVYDPSSRGGQPRGKQTVSPSSIWYTSSSGIWQTVWLEAVNAAYIERYEVVPDAETGTVRVKVIASDPTCKFSLVARDGEDIVATTDKVRVGQEVTLTIPDAKLWSPDSPFLYNLDIYLCADNCEECDRARGYFGLRTLKRAMIDGHPGFLLNGKPLFMFGPLDQGWWPDGLLTPPSYEAMVYDLKTIKALGMNMVRKHIKVENDLWFEWCDRNGIIVWQDMPSGSESGSIGTKEEIQHNFYRECINIVNAVKQHPCIGVWVPYNEGWGQDAGSGAGHTMRGYIAVRNADADMGRLMNSVSGWTDFGIGDMYDCHSYPSPNGHTNTANERINVCGEYGGITLMIDGHLWAGSQQTYTQVTNSEDYTARFNQYTMALQALQQSRGLWAGVYTQITDVEQEVNGILTYDRKVLKVNDEQLASIRAKIEQTINNRVAGAVSVVDAGDNNENVVWRYVTEAPADGWEKADFDDSAWGSGKAGFGKISQADARVRTTWDTDEIWIRRHFTLKGVTEENRNDLCIRLFYDEDSEVYINGVFAMSITGYNQTYQLFDISDAARAALNLSGDNVIAIHTKQTSGGQYIDAGFSIRSYKSNASLSIEDIAEVPDPTPAEDPEQAYLLCYSTENTQKMLYAYSYDGLAWQTLNGGKSVFGGTDGELNIQGPFIRRLVDEDGNSTFHLVHGGGDNTTGIFHWTSDNLVDWAPINGTDGKIIVTKGLTPEFAYDPTSKYYFYFWSYLSGNQYVVQYSRSKELTSFSKAATYISPGYSARDFHVFKDGDYYVALFNDPDSRGLCTAYSKYLSPTRGKFQNFQQAFAGAAWKLQSPATYPSFAGDGWFLLGTQGSSQFLFATPMAEVSKLNWHPYMKAAAGVPEDLTSGKVLVVSRAELSYLLMHFDGIDTAIPSVGPQPAAVLNDAVYNLAGQRVATQSQLRAGRAALAPGVYVTGGKKVAVK